MKTLHRHFENIPQVPLRRSNRERKRPKRYNCDIIIRIETHICIQQNTVPPNIDIIQKNTNHTTAYSQTEFITQPQNNTDKLVECNSKQEKFDNMGAVLASLFIKM